MKFFFLFQNLCGPKEINSREIWHFQRIGVSLTKFEKKRIRFKSDVFAAAAVAEL